MATVHALAAVCVACMVCDYVTCVVQLASSLMSSNKRLHEAAEWQKKIDRRQEELLEATQTGEAQARTRLEGCIEKVMFGKGNKTAPQGT